MRFKFSILIVLIISIFYTSCSKTSSYYTTIPNSETYNLEELFELLNNKELDEQERYAVVLKITNAYTIEKQYDRLIMFLTGIVEKHPESIYNARYLLNVAWVYSQQGAEDIALLYFDRIVKNFPDLIINDESIHCICLKHLIDKVSSPEQRIEYRKELLARFPYSSDEGTNYFMLATDYTAIGDWDNTLDSYKHFLAVYKQEVPGFPNAVQDAKQFVNFATSQKNWTYPSIDELLDLIRTYIRTANVSGLNRLRAKVGFFAMNWHQEANDGNSSRFFNLGVFIRGGNIHISPTVEPYSNSKEVYLKTSGWADRTSTWYFYFKKIDFPADPEVHGEWEWAGLYFGERVQ